MGFDTMPVEMRVEVDRIAAEVGFCAVAKDADGIYRILETKSLAAAMREADRYEILIVGGGYKDAPLKPTLGGGGVVQASIDGVAQPLIQWPAPARMKRPSYLDHDPTKHGKLTKRPNNHRYARTKR